jgi:hypothetical protein
MLLSPAAERRTSVPGSGSATVCNIKPFTAVNSAVVAPMPIASDSRTTRVQPLVCSNMR